MPSCDPQRVVSPESKENRTTFQEMALSQNGSLDLGQTMSSFPTNMFWSADSRSLLLINHSLTSLGVEMSTVAITRGGTELPALGNVADRVQDLKSRPEGAGVTLDAIHNSVLGTSQQLQPPPLWGRFNHSHTPTIPSKLRCKNCNRHRSTQFGHMFVVAHRNDPCPICLTNAGDRRFVRRWQQPTWWLCVKLSCGSIRLLTRRARIAWP